MDDSNALHITKPFMSGRSQAIRIPKEYRIEETEVVINKVGDCLMITPVSSLQDVFFSGISMITEDFLEDGRPEETSNERTSL